MHGIALMADRADAVESCAEGSPPAPTSSGSPASRSLAYRPGSRAADAEGLAAELAERLEGDLERGFTGHGPHRDDLALRREDHDLRAYGSQGQQRLALLALLLAEREAIGATRGARRSCCSTTSCPSSTPTAAAGSSASSPAGRPSSPRPSSSTCPAPTPGSRSPGGSSVRDGAGDSSAARGGAHDPARPPRPLENALGPPRPREWAPATLLADVQAVWEGVVGPALAREAEPSARAGGVLTVACSSSLWAHELDLMGPVVVGQPERRARARRGDTAALYGAAGRERENRRNYGSFAGDFGISGPDPPLGFYP